MFLGSYTYSGEPAALLAGYHRLLDRLTDSSLDLHVAAVTPTGLIVVDGCPSAEEFSRFSTGPEFHALTAAAGLPLPEVRPLGEVVHAVLRAPVPTGGAAMTGTPTDLALLDAVGQADLVRRGEVTATELVEAAIARIEAVNPLLNAVICTDYDRALARAAGRPSGPLAGVPYLLKDLVVEQEGVPFTEGSRFLAGNVSTVTSELVHRLERAGLIVLGRTNSPEFGLLPACEPTLHGPTRNPWSLGHSTSGSSGGSAAAVAAGMVPAAHGNDLGGSLRYPASACGLVGLKPTRARVPLGPLYGDVLSGMGVEHALTRTVRDSAALLDTVAGPDLGDPYPAPPLRRPLAAEVGADPGRLRIAWSARRADGRPAHPDCEAALGEAVTVLAGCGHELVEAGLPGLTDEVGAAIGTLFDAAAAWIAGYWIRVLGREPGRDELEPLTRAYWQSGRRISAAAYLGAVETIQRFGRRVAGFLDGYHAYLTPTLSTPPAEIGWITSTWGSRPPGSATARRRSTGCGPRPSRPAGWAPPTGPGWPTGPPGNPADGVRRPGCAETAPPGGWPTTASRRTCRTPRGCATWRCCWPRPASRSTSAC